MNVFGAFRELYESSPPQTRVAVGAAFSFWFVSRVSSFSAAVALAGAFASLAAIGAAAAEDFFARTARFLKTAPERFAKEKLKPALAAAAGDNRVARRFGVGRRRLFRRRLRDARRGGRRRRARRGEKTKPVL
jgi:hypothetical protein